MTVVVACDGSGTSGAGDWAPARAARKPAAHASASLAVVRRSVIRGSVIRRFLRDKDVMRMTLLHRRGAHLNEAGAGAQILDGPRAAVPHAGPQTPHQLSDE